MQRITHKTLKTADESVVLIDWNTKFCDSMVLADYARSMVKDKDLLVVRVNLFRSISLETIQDQNTHFVKGRFRENRVFFLFSNNFKLHLFEQTETGFTKNTDAVIRDRLRQAELLLIESNAKSVYRAGDGILFRTPSGSYVTHFMRTGNIQTSIASVDILFFWLTPLLKNIDAIIVDTWSFSSTALNASRRLEAYQAKHIDIPIFVDILPSYFDGSPSSIAELSGTLDYLMRTERKNIIFLFSASATFRSSLNIKTYIDKQSQLSFMDYTFVSCYSLSKTTVDNSGTISLCNLSEVYDFKSIPPSESETNSHVIDIDESTYFPLYDAKDTLKLKISSTYTKPSKEFLDRFCGSEVFQIHRDAVTDDGHTYNHHAFYIDTNYMLDNAEFKGKIESYIESINQAPILIIAPRHNAARNFTNLVNQFISSVFGATSPIFLVENILESSEATEKLQAAKDDDLVLVIDDVRCTGTRIVGYQRQLRSDVGYNGHVNYLVGVARYDDEKEFDDWIKDRQWHSPTLGYENRFDCIESIMLPNWDESHCPWCQEKKELQSLLTHEGIEAELNALVSERISILNSTYSSGLVNNVFWKLQNDDKGLQLGQESLFIEGEVINESDVVISVASALQRARKTPTLFDEESLHLGINSTTRVTLDNSEQFRSRWSDIVLQVSIWRLAHSYELRTNEPEYESSGMTLLKTLIKSSQSSDETGVILLEASCSLMLRKLPKMLSQLGTLQIAVSGREHDLFQVFLKAYAPE